MTPASFNFVDPNWDFHKANFAILGPKDVKKLGYGGREYQTRRHKELLGKKRTITIAPTGSGKSLMQVFDASVEIIQSDYAQRQIFIVPQVNIGNGFTQNKHSRLSIDNDVYDWEITENCLDGENTVGRMRNFLLKKSYPLCKPYRVQKVLGGITAICTYQAFLAAFNSMTNAEKKRAIKNASFRIDEMHHISGVSDQEAAEMNRMGEFMKFLLDHDGSTHLTTATCFRGNRHAIIQGSYYDLFNVFRIQFLEHWETLGLKEIHQNYAAYKDGTDLMKQIVKSVSKEMSESHLIIVPSDGTKFFKKSNKLQWVKKLVHQLGELFGTEDVLDLVTPERQSRDKILFISEQQKFKVVVTCAIGKEGSDWPPCSRIHNTVLDQSVLSAVQKFGRGLRQHNGKTNVVMTNYIEHFGKWDQKPEVIRKKLSDRFNCVVAASMWDDQCYPIMFQALPSDPEDKNEKPKFIVLEDLYGDKRNQVIDQLMRMVLAVPKSSCTAEVIDQIIDEVIESFEEDMLVDVDTDVLRDRLRKEVLRRQNPENPTFRFDGMIIDFIRENGWDKVVKKNIAGKSVFVGKANTKELMELQRFFTDEWVPMFEEVKRLGIRFIIDNKEDYPELYQFAKRNTMWIKKNHA